MTRATDQDTLWSRVEDAGLNAIAPPQQRWVDGWLVRFSPGKAQRARCINAVSSGRLTLAQRLEVCREIYLEQGLPMLVRITPFSQPASLDAELHSFGYILDGPTCVMFCSPIPDCIPRLSNVDLSVVSVRAFAHIVGELRGTSRHAIEAHAQRLEHSPVRHQGLVLRDSRGRQVIACAQMAVEGKLVGLYDVFTAPASRRQGLAHQLCAHLMQIAATQGATATYLQVESNNLTAQSVYRKLGFTDAYSYHYRKPPPPAEPG